MNSISEIELSTKHANVERMNYPSVFNPFLMERNLCIGDYRVFMRSVWCSLLFDELVYSEEGGGHIHDKEDHSVQLGMYSHGRAERASYSNKYHATSGT